MSTDSAADYADSIAKQIQENVESGNPFGVAEEGYGDTEAGEPLSGFDYIQDVLDIQYIVSGDRTYRAARVLIAYGGPNAWLNTLTSQLEVSWWSEPVYRDLPVKFVEALDAALKELWEMGE